jgi:uncharacterized protein
MDHRAVDNRPHIVRQRSRDGTSGINGKGVGRCHTLGIGDEVHLRITGPCGRCVMTTLAQGELPPDREILRTAVQHHQGKVGVYAAIVQGGTMCCGDRVGLDT